MLPLRQERENKPVVESRTETHSFAQGATREDVDTMWAEAPKRIGDKKGVLKNNP